MMRASLGALLVLVAASGSLTQASTQPERVAFASADGETELVGYVFKPRDARGRLPAVVMMHGRAGAYSSLANGVYDASTLSRRHRAWGELWAAQGYLAILVDGFGPRGYPQGFPRHSYAERPAALNEVTVRPLDAYGALAYLRTRADVIPDRIALQGWSNGGSATLATMAAERRGFAGAIALYPACGLKGQFVDGLVPYAPVRVFHGSADEEVSPRRCAALVEASRARGGDIEIVVYPGATHGFDDPGARRQRVAANATATEDVIRRAAAFIASILKR